MKNSIKMLIVFMMMFIIIDPALGEEISIPDSISTAIASASVEKGPHISVMAGAGTSIGDIASVQSIVYGESKKGLNAAASTGTSFETLYTIQRTEDNEHMERQSASIWSAAEIGTVNREGRDLTLSAMSDATILDYTEAEAGVLGSVDEHAKGNAETSAVISTDLEDVNVNVNAEIDVSGEDVETVAGADVTSVGNVAATIFGQTEGKLPVIIVSSGASHDDEFNNANVNGEAGVHRGTSFFEVIAGAIFDLSSIYED